MEDLPITWEALDGFRQMQDHYGEVFHAYLGGEGGGMGPNWHWTCLYGRRGVKLSV